MTIRPGMQIGDKTEGRGRFGDAYRMKKREEESYVSSVIKWLMFSFNLLFCIVACVFVGVGIWSHIVSQDYRTRAGYEVTGVFDIFFDTSALFMTFGVLVFILSFLGMLGSLRENICLLKTFFILLMIIFLLEIATVIVIFALSGTIRTKLQELIKIEGIEEYRSDIDRVNFIDWFQETYECCGVGEEGWRIWANNKYFNCSSPGFEACAVPYSCCRDPYTYDSMTINTRCGSGMLEEGITESEASNTIYTRGCVDVAILAIQDNMFIIGGIGVGIVIPQLLGIFLARVLWGQIDDQLNR